MTVIFRVIETPIRRIWREPRQISATSAREGFAPEKVINGVSRDENGIRNMWSSDGISPEGETLTLKLASVKKVSQVRRRLIPTLIIRSRLLYRRNVSSSRG